MKRRLKPLFCLLIAAVFLLPAAMSPNVVSGNAEAVPRDVLDIIDKVYAAEPGTFPEDEVSEEDWRRVINEGGKAGEDLVDYLARNASVREIESLDENDERFDDLDSDYTPSDSVSYDCTTQTVTIVDNSEITRITEEGEDKGLQIDETTSAVEDYKPYDWPDYWHEDNPQIYSNTRSTFRLTYSINGKQYIGSAFKIGPYHLGTAGHNLYEPSSGKWAGRITAIPSCRSASPQRPYGTAYSEYMEVGGYWYNSGDATDDWGVIEVDRNTVPDQMTLMSVGDNTSLNGKYTRGQGYPGILEDTLWLIRGKVTRTGRRLVRVDSLYIKGMSGGPVLNADENRIIGIVRGDKGEFVKFDNWIYNKMNSYQ